MIPQAAITAWSTSRPWPSSEAIEQDLQLARAIVEVYRHPLLRDELAFRGGTCLHQIHLAQPRRYSEDLDFVRVSNTPIGPVYDALRDVAATMGITDVQTVSGRYPKIRWRTPATSDPQALLRIKIEMRLDPADILAAFTPYRPDSRYTRTTAIETFRGHLADAAFRGDLNLLVSSWPDGYNIELAGQLIIDELLTKL